MASTYHAEEWGSRQRGSTRTWQKKGWVWHLGTTTHATLFYTPKVHKLQHSKDRVLHPYAKAFRLQQSKGVSNHFKDIMQDSRVHCRRLYTKTHHRFENEHDSGIENGVHYESFSRNALDSVQWNSMCKKCKDKEEHYDCTDINRPARKYLVSPI